MPERIEKLVETGTRGEIIDELIATIARLQKLEQALEQEQRFVRLIRDMFPDFYVVWQKPQGSRP